MSRALTQRGLKAAVKTDACSTLVSLNIFAGTEHDSANYGKVQESFRKHTAETANKGRAPPKGGVKYSLEPYSNQQIENWKSSKKIIVYKNEDQLLNFVRKAVIQKDYNGKMYFGIVSDNLVARVEAEAGVKLKKLNVTLRAGNVRKVFKDHGSETTEKLRGQRTIEIEDFALIPDVIETPDSIEISEYKGKTALNFAKVINNSRVSVYAVDSGSSLELFVQTMYAGKKKESIADISDATKASEKTSETSAGTAPNTNISNTSKNVNEKFSREPVSDSAYMKAVERRDTESAQRMVDEAAKKAGYTVKMYHGSKRGGGFTVFRDWSYFTKSKKYAQRYTERGNDKSLYSAYVKIENAFDTRKAADRYLFDEIRQEYGMGEIQDTGLPDWTDGYDIADYIDENGLNYDAIILDEGGDLVDGKPISRGLSYVIRNSNNIKSAEPITYDNNGNVIPLSERFKDNNPDIRYSREPERPNELRRQNERKLAQATAEDAANENERGLIKDYKRQYDKVSGIAEKLNTARQEVLTAERSGGGNTTAKKKIKKHRTICPVFGRGRRLRTLGLRFWRPPLYQLSYSPIKLVGLQGLEPQTDRL